MEKPAHVKRMEEELYGLRDRVAKLDVFVDSSPVFSSLSAIDQDLLKAQSAAMKAYSTILDVRLGRAQ